MSDGIESVANTGLSISLLHFDDALLKQPEFLAACRKRQATQFDLRKWGEVVRLWAKASELEDLKAFLDSSLMKQNDGRLVVRWMGSGDFHHVSALLIELLAKQQSDPLTVVHFDNHPDWVAHTDGTHCGSWVRHILDEGIVARVVSIGINSRDVVWPDLKGGGVGYVQDCRHIVYALRPARLSPLSQVDPKLKGFRHIPLCSIQTGFSHHLAERVLADIETNAIYITIDKDVLKFNWAATNWDQGLTSIDALAEWIAVLFRHRQVVGVDVIGDYSQPHYSGSFMTRLRKHCEVLIDQPLRRPYHNAAKVNQHGNLRLISEIEAAQC